MSLPTLTVTLLLLAPLLILLGVAVLYAYWVHIEHRLTEVSPGRVYTSSAMPPARVAALAQRLSVRTVLDFRHEHEGGIDAERETLARVGVHHMHLPSDQNPNETQIRRFVEAIGNRLDDGDRVLMHCHHGEGRAVFFAGVYRVMFERWSGEQAFRASQRLPRSLAALNRLFPSLGRLSERNPKSRMLRALCASRVRGGLAQAVPADTHQS